MVEQTAETDTFQVVETWKGDLQPGERLAIPELKPGPHAVPISQLSPEEWGVPFDSARVEIPKQIPGSRMVLFLKTGNQAEASLANGQEVRRKWEPANRYQDMKTAAVWIDGESIYCFEQVMNPGPSVLVRLVWPEWDKTISRWKITEVTLTSLQARVDHVVQIQRDLRNAVQLEDVATRIEQLRPFARSDVPQAQRFAMEELGKTGTSALPVLRAMLDDPEYAEFKLSVMRAYIDAGGAAVGDELSHRLAGELAFWKKTGPSLAPGWWDYGPGPNASLRQRYAETQEIIRGLAISRPFSALNSAIELRDFWRSLPQLDDPSGLDRLAEECDQLIRQIGSN